MKVEEYLRRDKPLRPLNEKSWTPEEYRVIAKHAGKISLNEITVLVNNLGIATRSPSAVMSAGNKHGFSFKLVA